MIDCYCFVINLTKNSVGVKYKCFHSEIKIASCGFFSIFNSFEMGANNTIPIPSNELKIVKIEGNDFDDYKTNSYIVIEIHHENTTTSLRRLTCKKISPLEIPAKNVVVVAPSSSNVTTPSSDPVLNLVSERNLNIEWPDDLPCLKYYMDGKSNVGKRKRSNKSKILGLVKRNRVQIVKSY